VINKNNFHTCYNAAVKVSELGEFNLIEKISDLVKEKNISSIPDRELLIGIGDDSAVWKSLGKFQMCTTDCLIQNVHFDLAYTGWQDLGIKSIAVNLSDIAAMGGFPRYTFVSLAMPPDTEVDDILTLYRGMIETANKYGIHILGGNISAADKLIINIAVHGYSKTSSLLTRSTALAGDLIAVTGFTGLSAAGLIMLKNKLSFEEEAAAVFSGAHLRPNPRIKEGQMLVSHGARTAIDISDGLLADLGHICESSRVSAIVREELVPISPFLKKYFKDDYMNLALTGGEDYELLFTASRGVFQKVKASIQCPVTIIGEIVKQNSAAITVIDSNGKSALFAHTGWNHFKQDINK